MEERRKLWQVHMSAIDLSGAYVESEDKVAPADGCNFMHPVHRGAGLQI